MKLKFNSVPDFAKGDDYPNNAITINQTYLPFYCINCDQKSETAYLTPNFGPFCKNCIDELMQHILILDFEEIKALCDFFMNRVGYISREFDQPIHDLTAKLENYLNEKEKK